MPDFTTLLGSGPRANENPWANSPRFNGGVSGSPLQNPMAYARNVNQFMTGQSVNPFIANLPGYSTMVGQRSANTSQQLRGQLPEDVIRQISQQAAERGIATGQGQGPNTNAAYLRALGLNSLGMMQQGSQNLTQSIADTPVPQLFNPASFEIPQFNAQQELASARAGIGSGGGGARISGMPNLGAPIAVGKPSNFDSPTFTNGMWNGNDQSYNPNLASDWWSSYGVPQKPNEFAGNNIDFGQFAAEDANVGWWE